MKAKTSLLCDLLECGYMDINYLTDLLDKNNIEIDLQDLKANYWVLNFNWIVYDVINRIAEKFIEENQEEIENISNLWDSNIYNYDVSTNYIDSHLQFNDEKVQELFDNSKYFI